MPKSKTKLNGKNNMSKRAPKIAINPIVAGVAGAAVGAGVGVAASAALSTEKNRKKVGDAINTVRKKAMQVMESMDTEQSLEEGKQAAKKVMRNTTKRIGERIGSTKSMNGRSHIVHA